MRGQPGQGVGDWAQHLRTAQEKSEASAKTHKNWKRSFEDEEKPPPPPHPHPHPRVQFLKFSCGRTRRSRVLAPSDLRSVHPRAARASESRARPTKGHARGGGGGVARQGPAGTHALTGALPRKKRRLGPGGTRDATAHRLRGARRPRRLRWRVCDFDRAGGTPNDCRRPRRTPPSPSPPGRSVQQERAVTGHQRTGRTMSLGLGLGVGGLRGSYAEVCNADPLNPPTLRAVASA